MSDKDYFSPSPVDPVEITPESVYRNRRKFLKAMGLLGAGALLAACSPVTPSNPSSDSNPNESPLMDLKTTAQADELGDPLNTFEEITNYNNYYEFSTSKERVASLAQDFRTSPWQVRVDGLVSNPKTYTIEEILEKFPQQERVYRLRCVEAWSMVIPWNGFPLAQLLNEVEPKPEATHVRFVTIYDPDQMPGQKSRQYPWPYQEGLRLDEARHDLTILATGLYGEPLPPQDGAPLRVVVPWKYGFKSIKSIVKIELVDHQPDTLWSTIAPNEYGFYSNVNPEVSHPRWSQASERRIGESGRRATLPFNGYAEQVASLYNGMNLQEFY